MSVFRDLYFDLLKKSLLGFLDEDPAMDPWTEGFNPVKRYNGEDWPSRALSMIGARRMDNIADAITLATGYGALGDYVETGVWRGGSCIFARAVLNVLGEAERTVWVCDSFAGLPAPGVDAHPADRGDRHHLFTELAVSRKDVEAAFKRYGLNGRVRFVEGWFHESLPKAPIGPIAVLRLDGDMYMSTKPVLDVLYDRVSEWGCVIVDDYHAIPGCRAAVDEFRAEHGVTGGLAEIDGIGVWWQKRGT